MAEHDLHPAALGSSAHLRASPPRHLEPVREPPRESPREPPRDAVGDRGGVLRAAERCSSAVAERFCGEEGAKGIEGVQGVEGVEGVEGGACKGGHRLGAWNSTSHDHELLVTFHELVTVHALCSSGRHDELEGWPTRGGMLCFAVWLVPQPCIQPKPESIAKWLQDLPVVSSSPFCAISGACSNPI